MAIDLSRFNFLKRLDARARIFFIFAAVVAFILIVYFLSRFLFGGSETTGPTRIANAPQGLQSVPAGQLTPEYQRALVQANAQAAQQAQMTGGSAIPTVINIGQQPNTAGCIICSDDSANVKLLMDDWVKQGRLAPELASTLQQLADRNASVDEFAAALNELVRQGKLTPEQARALLDQYKKQYANRLLQDSAQVMDGLIKNGQLPIDAATLLLDAQKGKATPSDYAALLQDLVRQGKISPAMAQQLLAQYAQQRAREIVMRSIGILRRMVQAGELTADVEKEIEDLETRLVPVDVFVAAMQRYVAAGRMTPVVSNKVIDEYKEQKAEIGPSQSIDQLIKEAEAAAFTELKDLLQEGKITPEVASQIAGMIQQDVTLDAFQSAINQLVTEKKLTPEIAKLKIADYQKVKGLREMAKNLALLQGNNASPSSYADELKRAVAAGLLTPEQAAQLMQEYAALTSRAALQGATGGSDEFAQLQQRVGQGEAAQTNVPTAGEFNVAQTQVAQETSQDRLARIQNIMANMAGQAQQLISAWQPPVMMHREGSYKLLDAEGREITSTRTSTSSKTTITGADELAPAFIKAGTVLFAVLDTAVNSDYPDTPVMATVVGDKFKGAKLLGKMVTTKGVAGQLDRVSLNFTRMNMEAWPRSRTIQGYAIDPDTARVVMASDVDYHYLKRYGAIMATAFLQGYASAITTSGSTATTGIFGTSSTYPQLDPKQKFFVGLGQVGQTLGQAVQNYINIPPTVKVDSGVGLGILFMDDIT
ncbi:MAG: hypothetical protein H0W64_12250 [Gammaproteobacteria bacterium]|nr:hypothetical protein [Gammaproteobacteria bacterium]